MPASGSIEVVPGASTTYMLPATNASGTRTATASVGVGPFRYFRFVPVAVRAGTAEWSRFAASSVPRGWR